MRRSQVGYLLFSVAFLLAFCTFTRAENKNASKAGPPIIDKWDRYKLLWEYNKDTGIYKQFKYEIAGRKWVLKKVIAVLNIDRNQKVDKNDAGLYTLNYGHGRFKNMVHNGATLKLIPERFLPSIDSLDHRGKKEAVLEVLTRNVLSYVKEMEENKERVTEMQRHGELGLTQSELTNLIGILDHDISRASRHLENLENNFRQAKIKIEKKQNTYFVGRQGYCTILEAKWDGLVCSREVRYDHWTERTAYEKTFNKIGLADKFYELDQHGTRHLYGRYEYSGSQMTHIVMFDSNGNPVKRVLFNCARVAGARSLYTYSPYGLKIKVSKNKWIFWPSRLKLPVGPKMISFLMCHNDHAILPIRTVRK
jgi:hypothetical protein